MKKYLIKLFVQLSFYLRINRYLCKSFLINFLKIFLAFFAIIFFVNFIESIDDLSDKSVSLGTSMLIAFLKTPDFINSVSPSLVLFSLLITFFTLSGRSEITTIRCAGYSMWHLAMPLILASFILGIFWITVFNNISIYSYKMSTKLESQITISDKREVIKPKSGIWLKQKNADFKDGYVVIKSSMLFKDRIEMIENSLWFFDDESKFYKKVDCHKMFLGEGFWEIPLATVNEKKSLNTGVKDLKIPTDLDRGTFSSKFLNNLEDPRLFTIFSMPGVISDLNNLGMESRKFKIQLNYLISLPILFAAMVLVSLYFGIHSFRDSKSFVRLVFGLALGLAIYIMVNFIKELGASKLIPIFVSTWLVVFICFAMSVIGIYKKE